MKIKDLWINIRAKNKTKSDLKKTLSGMQSQIRTASIGMAAALGLFARQGIQQASSFAENWSVVTNAVGKETQDAFMQSFANLKRISKAEFADIAATIVGTLKSKDIDDSIIAKVGPQVIQRLEDTAAYFEKTPEQALHAFTSMISGMARPMEMLTKGAVVPLVTNLDRLAEEKYGMSFEKLAPDEQTLLRLQFFLDGTAKVPYLLKNSVNTIGTYKGSLDSMKKSLADTSAEFSLHLMPALIKVMPLLTKMAEFVSNNAKLIIGLGLAFAGFKLGSFVGQITKAISLLIALATAKTLSKTTLFAIPAVLGLAGAATAAIFGIAGMSGGGSSSSASQKNTSPIIINVSGGASVDSVRGNNAGHNVQTNFGRGDR